jgi:hypothetical protein
MPLKSGLALLVKIQANNNPLSFNGERTLTIVK